MAKKKYTDEQLREIEMLRQNNRMLENTMKEMESRGASKTAMRQVVEAKKDVVEHLSNLGVKDEVVVQPKKKPKGNNLFDTTPDKKDVFDLVTGGDKKEETLAVHKQEPTEVAVEHDTQLEDVIMKDSMYNDQEKDMSYDVIPLPSKGEGYPSKIDRLPVSYLTAYDENLITSPNLYRDGLVIDFLLKNKIMTDDINVDDLLSGDADAVILFLRATSYGTEFPIIVRDPESGEQIDAMVDLSKLKAKEFNLVGDENGWFEYETPLRHDKIKFRYMTRKQEKQLKKMVELEGYGTRAKTIQNIRNEIIDAVSVENEMLTDANKSDIRKCLNVLKDWSEKLEKKNDSSFNKIVTNNLLMQIMEVNGNQDREYIRNFINNMPARDSLMLRRYINDNLPGINFEVEVERPESLGGGSFKTFLNWDDSVFLNLPDV